MNRRAAWTTGFLSLTLFALVAELWASFDGDPVTDPWTDLIVRHIPGEITAVAIGGLSLWLPVHFGIRYWRKHRDAKTKR